MDDMNREVLEAFQKEFFEMKNILTLLKHVMASQLGVTVQSLDQSIEPSLQKHLREVEKKVDEHLSVVTVGELLYSYQTVNRSMLHQIQELQLRILSHQTGRSVLVLRNELLS